MRFEHPKAAAVGVRRVPSLRTPFPLSEKEPVTKQITLYDFLTEAEIEKAAAMWRQNNVGYAKRVCQEIITPHMQRINAALGQENDPMYLAYAVEYVMGEASRG